MIWIHSLMAVSYIIFWVSRFAKQKRTMLYGHSVGICFRIVAFFLSHNLNGITNAVLICIRNTVIQKIDRKVRCIKFLFYVSYLAVSWSLYFLAYEGIGTWFVALSGSVTTAGFVFGGEQSMRIVGMCGSLLYSGFLFFSAQWVGFVLELITALANFVSFVYYLRENRISAAV